MYVIARPKAVAISSTAVRYRKTPINIEITWMYDVNWLGICHAHQLEIATGLRPSQ